MASLDVDPADLADWELKYALAREAVRQFTVHMRALIREEGSPALATWVATVSMVEEGLEAGYLATCFAVALACLCEADYDRTQG